MQSNPDEFSEFFRDAEPRLRIALSAQFGFDLGRDAACEALRYGWEHWSKVRAMSNPKGYLFRVGERYAVRERKRRTRVWARAPQTALVEPPWVEPRLSRALMQLSERQRVVVVLVFGLEWLQTEVADLLGLSLSTVQNHLHRGLEKLRTELEVSP